MSNKEMIEPEVMFYLSKHTKKNIKMARKTLKPARNVFFRKKYTQSGQCQVTGVAEYRDGYCRQLYRLRLLLESWESN